MNNAANIAVDERKQLIEKVRAHLKRHYPSDLLNAYVDSQERQKMKETLKKDFPHLSDDELEYSMREIVGFGVIEEIMEQYKDVTDISFNGTHLDVVTNTGKIRYGKIDEEYIVKIIKKFGNACKKEFTPNSPIIDATYGNLRLNAVHKNIAQYGTTMALRIVRPRLALTKDNFAAFAPEYVYAIFEAIIASKSNVIISGETGTGKTELQKLLISMIDYKDHIIMIEDTPESHVKTLFPDKDIKSWVTNASTSIGDLVKAGLRNNPVWMIPAEVRGKEASEMIQAALTGHRLIAGLHSESARAIVSRLINMMKMGDAIDEESMKEDLHRYLDFGVHLEKITGKDGKVIRYLKEIVEFLPGGEVLTVFRCDLTNDGFRYHDGGKISSNFVKRMMEKLVPIELQEKLAERLTMHEVNT
ncbi:CpaF/VirB11 family protein [Bacillus aerius]|uniref:CpaF/VirB11 family protein n=1 Tax=Bacillus aerius TaxID=293388 RepID=UPI00247DC42D|nr:CpaF/VirB11 family protein [Bacillus aerius]MDH6595447.1 pilus assembly protein CpaF [Bacillus aerius]